MLFFPVPGIESTNPTLFTSVGSRVVLPLPHFIFLAIELGY